MDNCRCLSKSRSQPGGSIPIQISSGWLMVQGSNSAVHAAVLQLGTPTLNDPHKESTVEVNLEI